MPMLSITCANAVYHRLSTASDGAQTEGKVPVTPESWLPRNNRKTYYSTFVTSAELAYGRPSQEAPKNIRGQAIDRWFLCRPTFWNIDWKMFFFGILSIQCKFRCNRPSDTRRSFNRLMLSTFWPPLVYFSVSCISFWLEFWAFYLKFYTANLC